MSSETKVCKKCKIEKELEEFHRDSKMSSGHGSVCKICVKELGKIYRSKNRERLLLSNKEYRTANLETVRAKDRERSKKKWKFNREHVSKQASEYYKRHKVEILQKAKKYRESNREEVNLRVREWRLVNKHVTRTYSKVRELKERRALPAWANLEKIKDIYKDRQLLSEMTGIEHHVDHIIPLRGKLVSGLHVENNLRIIPAIENLSKNNQFLEELL